MKINYIKVVFAVVAGVLASSVWVHASEIDSRIEESAQKSYVFKTYLSSDAINIQSKDGFVSLTGTVNDMSHKSLAQETVANLPGVKSVDNKLEYKGEMPAENSDGWLSMKVKAALLFNRNVSAVSTQVFVKDGIVTLKGEAQSQAQKDLTGEYAKDVEGIKDVTNEMTIAKVVTNKDRTMGEKIDDASITAQVKLALMSHHSTSAFNTKVETKDGVVIVSGSAKNGAEKDLVSHLINDIDGVVSVTNNMVITNGDAKK